MLAARAALAWARAYTNGMPEPVRNARLEELASDLWEQAEHELASGRRRLTIQLAIGGRIARGAVADLAWRVTHRAGLAGALLRGAGWAAFAFSGAFLLLFTGVSGSPVVGIRGVDEWDPGAWAFARATAIVFVMLAAGFALLATRPLAAAAVFGAVTASLVVIVGCVWPLFAPLAAICTVGAGVIAARRRLAPRRTPL